MAVKTVFVLGAGASCEANLPDGNNLKRKIADVLSIRVNRGSIERADDAILGAIQLLAKTGDLNRYLSVARDIVANMPHQISIDNFIDMRGDPEIEALSKVAIARCILDGEHASNLTSRTGRRDVIDIEKMPNTWFGKFAQILTVGTRKETIIDRLARVAFVVFNYDRCFEQYMHAAFKRFLGVDDSTAASFVAAIEIYHPYGRVGRLPWELHGSAAWQDNSGPTVPFGGGEINGSLLLEVSRQLRTFTEERTVKARELANIRELISDANRIVFLGFAFHEQNMRILFSDESSSDRPHVFGTLFKVERPDREEIQRRLRQLNFQESQMDLDDAECGAFLEARRRSLAFGA